MSACLTMYLPPPSPTQLTSPEGLWAMAATFGYLFALIQWQFFIRDIESSTSAKGGKGF